MNIIFLIPSIKFKLSLKSWRNADYTVTEAHCRGQVVREVVTREGEWLQHCTTGLEVGSGLEGGEDHSLFLLPLQVYFSIAYLYLLVYLWAR